MVAFLQLFLSARLPAVQQLFPGYLPAINKTMKLIQNKANLYYTLRLNTINTFTGNPIVGSGLCMCDCLVGWGVILIFEELLGKYYHHNYFSRQAAVLAMLFRFEGYVGAGETTGT